MFAKIVTVICVVAIVWEAFQAAQLPLHGAGLLCRGLVFIGFITLWWLISIAWSDESHSMKEK